MTRYWYIRHATNGPLCCSAFGARIIPGLVRRYAARSMAMVDLRAVRLQRPSDALAYRLVRVTVRR